MDKYHVVVVLLLTLTQIQCSGVRGLAVLSTIQEDIDTLRNDVSEIKSLLGITKDNIAKNIIEDVNEIDIIERGQILESDIPSISSKLKVLNAYRSMKDELEKKINAGDGNIEDYKLLSLIRNECGEYCQILEADINNNCELVKIIYFELDVRILSDDNKEILRNELVDTLWKLHCSNHRIYMFGYSCDLGTDKYDYQLSADRVENIKRYIFEALNNSLMIDEADIVIKPKGKAISNFVMERIPVDKREEIREKFRKVEIYIPKYKLE